MMSKVKSSAINGRESLLESFGKENQTPSRHRDSLQTKPKSYQAIFNRKSVRNSYNHIKPSPVSNSALKNSKISIAKQTPRKDTHQKSRSRISLTKDNTRQSIKPLPFADKQYPISQDSTQFIQILYRKYLGNPNQREQYKENVTQLSHSATKQQPHPTKHKHTIGHQENKTSQPLVSTQCLQSVLLGIESDNSVIRSLALAAAHSK